MPIVLADGSFWGTLCAIDPRPARLNNPETIGMFKLFAELIGFHLNASERFASSEANLLDERKTSELREQFIGLCRKLFVSEFQILFFRISVAEDGDVTLTK